MTEVINFSGQLMNTDCTRVRGLASRHGESNSFKGRVPTFRHGSPATETFDSIGKYLVHTDEAGCGRLCVPPTEIDLWPGNMASSDVSGQPSWLPRFCRNC